jgi:hypothetical protein
MYAVERIHGPTAIPGPVFRLKKSDGTQYTVAMFDHGPECTCGAGNFHGNEGPCKHVTGMQQVGLLRRGG